MISIDFCALVGYLQRFLCTFRSIICISLCTFRIASKSLCTFENDMLDFDAVLGCLQRFLCTLEIDICGPLCSFRISFKIFVQF